MIVVTSNVRDNPDMPQPHVRHDVLAVSKLRRATNARRAILWQEFGPEDRRTLQQTLRGSWQHLCTDTDNPISVTGQFDVRDSGHYVLHQGKAGVNPRRLLCWAIVRQRPFTPRGRSWPWFVLANLHLVNGAWSNPGQSAEAWRRHMWAYGYEQAQHRLARFRQQGLAVVGGGDLNRTLAQGPAWRPPAGRWITSHRFDHLFVQGTPTLRFRELRSGLLGTSQLWTDHAAVWAELEQVRAR